MIRCPKIVQASEGGGPSLARDGALRPGCRIKRRAAAPQSPKPGMALVARAGPVLQQRSIASRQAGGDHEPQQCSRNPLPHRAVGEETILRQCVTGPSNWLRHVVMSSVHVLYIRIREWLFAENAERSFCLLRITCGSAAAGARVAQNCCRRRRAEYSAQKTCSWQK